MKPEIDASGDASALENAGLPAGEAQAWLAALPELRGDFATDSRACSHLWELCQEASGTASHADGAQRGPGRCQRAHPRQGAGAARPLSRSACPGALRQADGGRQQIPARRGADAGGRQSGAGPDARRRSHGRGAGAPPQGEGGDRDRPRHSAVARPGSPRLRPPPVPRHAPAPPGGAGAAAAPGEGRRGRSRPDACRPGGQSLGRRVPEPENA